MHDDPLTLSVETLIAVSPLLGHKLEDRSAIRNGQDPELLREMQAGSTVELSNPDQALLFLVAPLDILCAETDGVRQFHLAETNGTGIGGLTNMGTHAVRAVLDGLTEMARAIPDPQAVVLVAVSGQESSKNPRRNHTIHEKALYLEALKRGFEAGGASVAVTSMPLLVEQPQSLQADCPTVILGYMKEYLEHLTLSADGRLALFGRPVTAAINDRFCLNVLSRFGHQVDMTRFATMNRCFLAGADKGVAYALVNDYTKAAQPGPLFPERIKFARANCRTELIATVMDWVREGRQAVIKAQGTGLGHGIEFFLDGKEPPDEIISRIDHSIRVTEHYYGLVGGAFPYTVCEFVNACAIGQRGGTLHGHKYELRMVIYRDGQKLKAFPSIIKISPKSFDAGKPVKLSLLNNISTSAEKTGTDGTEHMLPLCNHETLELLDLSKEQLLEICSFCTGYVRFILDRLQETPERFALTAGQDRQGVLGPLRPSRSKGRPSRESSAGGKS